MQRLKAEFDLRGLMLVVAAGAWMAGILIGSWVSLPPVLLLLGAAGTLFCAILLWSDTRIRLLMLILLSLLLGVWRYTIASPIGDPQAISSFIGTGKIDVRGSVADEPKLQGRARILDIAVDSVSTNTGASWQDAHGQLEVVTIDASIESLYGANYGDHVELQGKLQVASPHSPPGVFASMGFPRMSVSGSGGNPVFAALFHLRVRFASIIAQALPQPEAALLIAILLGLRTPALSSLTNAFNVTGTAHLIAPSGFKVTILAGLIITGTKWMHKGKNTQQGALLPAQKRKGNRRRWIAATLQIGVIAAYTILSGGGPAALRAGIMGILLVVAPRIGRIYNIYTSLALTGLLLSLYDPFVLWNVGFLLSFLGTLGIVLLTPLFQRLLHFMHHFPAGHFIAEIIAVTMAAQIATLPIFATTFNEVSLIAPIPNALTVPLLGPLILVGSLISLTGLISFPLAQVSGWLVYPLLLYVIKVVTWCTTVPWAFLTVGHLDSGLAWAYYCLLALVFSVLKKWTNILHEQLANFTKPLLPKRTWYVLQVSAAMLVILATGVSALAAQPDGRLTITFLNVGPGGQAAQGEAILIHTPDGKYTLIDGGLDATSLAHELDSRLPSWQRSLDVIVLTSPKADHLNGLQDIVNRYQVGEVLDAGMLHPNTGYAIWRRAIREHNLHYIQLHQGTTLAIGTQVALQVLWPPSPLHQGSNEELENGLIVRLIAPGLSVLLLGATALSKYVLTGLLSDIAPAFLQADIVQIDAQVGKFFPTELSAILQLAKPSYVVITPTALSAKQRKANTSSMLNPLPQLLASSTWQTLQTAEKGTIEISSGNQGWSINVV